MSRVYFIEDTSTQQAIRVPNMAHLKFIVFCTDRFCLRPNSCKFGMNRY